MIEKKKWEKSFKNVNGREPSVQEYQKAVSDGFVKEEVMKNKNDKRTIIIVGSILATLFIIIIAILLTLFFYPKPENNQTSHFNSGLSNSSSTSRSNLMTQSSSSEDFSAAITEWNNLSLNEQIALLAQAYAGLNPQTTLLSAEKIAMTANGNAGVNNGYIQWYADTDIQHKLDVIINNNTVSFSYIDNTTGQPEKKESKISELLSTYYQSEASKQRTQTLASKVVTPAELQNSNVKMNLSQIYNGDYSSIQGLWKDYQGNTIDVSGNSIKVTFGTISVSVVGLNYSSSFDYVGTGQLIFSYDDSKLVTRPEKASQNEKISEGRPFVINFIPKGINYPNSNMGEDRLDFEIGARAGGADFTYYKQP